MAESPKIPDLHYEPKIHHISDGDGVDILYDAGFMGGVVFLKDDQVIGTGLNTKSVFAPVYMKNRVMPPITSCGDQTFYIEKCSYSAQQFIPALRNVWMPNIQDFQQPGKTEEKVYAQHCQEFMQRYGVFPGDLIGPHMAPQGFANALEDYLVKRQTPPSEEIIDVKDFRNQTPERGEGRDDIAL